MGQVRDNETTIMSVLERAHRERYSFFRFDSGFKEDDHVLILEWLLRKLARQIDRESAWQYGLTSGFTINASPEEMDDIIRVSLDGFVYSPQEAEQFVQWLPGFKQQCQERAEALPKQTNLQKIFYRDPFDEGDINGASIIFQED